MPSPDFCHVTPRFQAEGGDSIRNIGSMVATGLVAEVKATDQVDVMEYHVGCTWISDDVPGACAVLALARMGVDIGPQGALCLRNQQGEVAE